MRHAFREEEGALQRFPPYAVDQILTTLGEMSVDRAAVGRIWDALHQAVSLQVVHQSGDIARADPHFLSQLAEGNVSLMAKAHQDLHPPLGQAVLLQPSLHTLVRPLDEPAHGGEAFEAPCCLGPYQWIQYFASPPVV